MFAESISKSEKELYCGKAFEQWAEQNGVSL